MRTARLLFIVALVIAPLAAEAQPAGKMYRIGMLETTSVALNAANLEAFRQGLRDLGYVERQDYAIEYRSADSRPDRFPDLASELVRLKVDLIVTRGTTGALATKNATRTLPIDMATSGDPVAAGLVASLARPGGNVTGLSSINAELVGKRLGLLKEAIPGIARIAVVLNLSNPTLVTQRKQIEVAARSLGFQPQFLDVRQPEDLGRAFDTAVKQRADAVHVGLDFLAQSNLGRIVDLAAKHRLPTIYSTRDFVDAGGLMAYGVSRLEIYRHAATYVDKILKGAKPADLPVEQPTKFELVINLKTAKALGLTIPPSLLLRADQVIEFVEARGPADFDGAFSDMTRAHAGALTVLPSPMFFNERRRFVDLAAKHRLPTVYPWREGADVGGLMAYGPSIADLYRRAATYVDKILKGTKPADLPVEQPTKFEVVINLKTAKALGLTIPPSLLQRADQVIE